MDINPYITSTILTEIQNIENNNTTIMKFFKDKVNFEVAFYDYGKSVYDKFLKYMGQTFAFISKEMNNPKIDLKIAMYNVDKPKGGKGEDVKICAEYVNSGYTEFKHEYKQIVVYRREENVKVLIHEIIHAFGFEFHTLNQGEVNKLNEHLKTVYHVKDPHAFEGVCDALTFMILREIKIDDYKVDMGYELMWKRVGEVILYSENDSWPPKKEFKQTTHGFEYYILKPVIVDLFIDGKVRIISAQEVIDALNSEPIVKKIKDSLANARKNYDPNTHYSTAMLEYDH